MTQILELALARLHEESAGWWDDLSAEQRKQYIKDHPNSKYAKQAGGGKSAAKKAAAPKPAPANDHKAAAEKAHADLTKYESELKALRVRHAPAFHKFNQLLDAAEREENPKKRAALEKRLDEMEKQPHIKKAIKLTNQKREAKKALAEAKKAAMPAPATTEKKVGTATKRADPPSKVVSGEAAHKAAHMQLSDDERQAFREYAFSTYAQINKGLRKGKKLDQYDTQSVKAMDAVFQRAKTTEPIKVYRGVRLPPELMGQMKSGATFSDSAYVSTSTELKTADDFANKKDSIDDNAIMHITVPAGSKAVSLEHLSPIGKKDTDGRENEILLNRNSKYRVISVEPGKGGKPATINVEYLG